MNRTKVKKIIHFSLYKNMQNKWFVIFNVITLCSVILMVNWGSIASLWQSSKEEKTFQVAVLDEDNLVYEAFEKELLEKEHYEVNRVTQNRYTAENIPDDFMLVEVKPHEEECFQVSIISKEGIPIEWYEPVIDTLFSIRNTQLAKEYQVSGETIAVIQRQLAVNRVMLSVEAEDTNTKEMIKLFSAAITYMITVFIFSKMSNEIVSEKQSKSTEYILTTVSAKEYLFAKIASNIAVLVLQGLFLLAYYFIAALILSITRASLTDFTLSASVSASMNQEIVAYILALIVYNILNLILLCIVQATIASKTSSNSEAGNTVSILLTIMMAAYISTIFFLKPYTKVNLLLYILSCLPVLSAYFVPGMMVIGQATVVQVVISLLVLLVTIPLTFHYCSQIFKNGILDYTKMKKKQAKEANETEKRNRYFAKREMKKFGFVIGIAAFIYVGTQVIFALLGELVLPVLFENQLGKTEITLLLQILLQVISLGLAYTFVASYSLESEEKVVERKKITLKTKGTIFLIALFLIFAAQLVLGVLLYPLIGLDYDTTDLFQMDAGTALGSKILFVIAIALTPGIFEELFFRKGIIDFSMKHGKIFALLFSALLFGIFHMNLSQGIFAFLMGLLLGWIYIETGDIFLTMLLHFTNNGFAALELILPEMGIIVVGATFLLVLMVGFVLFVKVLAQREKRQRILQWLKTPIYRKAFEEKYQYLFSEYTFDVALVLLAFMSIMTEKILR